MIDKETLLTDLKKLENQMNEMYVIERKIASLQSDRSTLYFCIFIIPYIALVIMLKEPLGYFDISGFFMWVIRLGAPCIIIPVLFNWLIKGLVSLFTSQEKNHLLEEYEQKWPTMAKAVYHNDIIPIQYLHLDYVQFLIKELEVTEALSLREALEKLDNTIDTIEARERSYGMISLDEGIHKEMEQLRMQVEHLRDIDRLNKKDRRKVEEEMSWVSKEPSCLRDQAYLYRYIKKNKNDLTPMPSKEEV